jgi:hypothetical protein
MLSEKLSRDGTKVTIFCERDDKNDSFVLDKVSAYRKNGFEVVVRNAEIRDRR